jgi:hypothetical protein
MYTVWTPIPLTLYNLTDQPLLLIGSCFGYLYLAMMVMTMMVQTGHLVHSVKQQANNEKWEERDNWMFAAFGGPYEVFANVLKGIWAFFLAITFWQTNEYTMAALMILFSFLSLYFFLLLIKVSTVKPVKFLSKIKSNPYFFNLETIAFFTVLVVYIHSKL